MDNVQHASIQFGMYADSWESTLVARDARGASYATFVLSQLSKCIPHWMYAR